MLVRRSGLPFSLDKTLVTSQNKTGIDLKYMLMWMENVDLHSIQCTCTLFTCSAVLLLSFLIKYAYSLFLYFWLCIFFFLYIIKKVVEIGCLLWKNKARCLIININIFIITLCFMKFT
jgi:hypothetical protein